MSLNLSDASNPNALRLLIGGADAMGEPSSEHSPPVARRGAAAKLAHSPPVESPSAPRSPLMPFRALRSEQAAFDFRQSVRRVASLSRPASITATRPAPLLLPPLPAPLPRPAPDRDPGCYCPCPRP